MERRWTIRGQALIFSVGLALACSAFGQPTSAPASAPATRVNCAVITDHGSGLRDSAVAALVETELAADTRFHLLERDRLDALLREQQIQVMFAPGSTPERMALGALLKVDLMIMLRVEKAGGREQLQVVICDTKSGYRLRVRQFDWPAGQEVGDQILSLVNQALEKYRSPSRAAFAVPRFLCKDFGPAGPDYRDVFARRMEQGLIAYPSIVLVELPEATAIANELGRHNTGQALERQLPYSLVGEYETAQRDGHTSFNIRVILRRGTQTLKTYRSADVSLVEATNFIASIPREVLRDTLLTVDRNPELEVAEMVRQAESFSRSGDNETALSLVSAAILVRPNNSELLKKGVQYAERVEARQVSGDLDTWMHVSRGYRQLKLNYLERWSRLAKRESVSRLVLELEGVYPAAGELQAGWQRYGVFDRFGLWESLGFSSQQQSRYKEELEEDRKGFEAVVREIYEAKESVEGKSWRVGLEKAKRDPAARMEYIRGVQNIPEAETAIFEVLVPEITFWYSVDHRVIEIHPTRRFLNALKDAAVQKAIDEVAALPGTTAQKVARRLKAVGTREEEAVRKDEMMQKQQREQLDRALKPTASAPLNADHKVLSGAVPGAGLPREQHQEAEFTLEPLELRVAPRENPEGVQATVGAPALAGWLSCGPLADVLWSADEIFVMREPGLLRGVWHEERPCFQAPNAWQQNYGEVVTNRFVFDGKYVWAPAFAAPKPHLVVLDLQTGSIRTVGPEQGTPPMDQGLCVAALGPGQVCVAAGFRKDRQPYYPADAAWCAVLSLTAGEQVKIDFLLRANEQPPAGESAGAWRSGVSYGFRPGGVFVLRDATSSRDTIILFRQNTQVRASGTHALAIDVQSHDVRPIGEMLPTIRQDFVFVSGDALYMAQEEQLWKVSVPGPTVERQRIVPPGYALGPRAHSVAVTEGVFHIFSERGWALAPAPGEVIHVLSGRIPGALRGLGPIVSSRNYGTVALAGEQSEGMRPFAVKLSPGDLKRVQERAERDAASRAENRKTIQKVVRSFEERGPLDPDEPAQTPLEFLTAWAPVAVIALSIAGVLVWFFRRRRRD